MTDPELLSRIAVRPEVFGGKPIVRDMRIAVECVLGMPAAGDGAATVLAEYPGVDRGGRPGVSAVRPPRPGGGARGPAMMRPPSARTGVEERVLDAVSPPAPGWKTTLRAMHRGERNSEGEDMTHDDLLSRIVARPEVFGGKPIIRDMRISVELVLSLLAQGGTPDSILEDYPGLEPDDIRACAAYAHAVVAGDTLSAVAVADS